MIVKADLHIHSLASDGEAHPREIIRYARKLGIKVLAITDHDTFLGSYLASKYVSGDVISLYGAEVRIELSGWTADVLILCDHIPNVPIKELKELSNLVDVARSENCLLVPAHPFTIIRHGMGSLALANFWDAVEVFNGGNDPLTNLMNLIVLRNFKGPKLANSDAHVLAMIGKAYNILDINDLRIDDVLECVRKGPLSIHITYCLGSQVRRFSWGIRRKALKIPWGRDLINSPY